MVYSVERLSFLQKFKNVKDIIIIGQFYCHSKENILMYAHVASSEEVAQKGKIMHDKHTRLINVCSDAQKTIEPSYTAMGSANNFMIAGNGAHVNQAISIIRTYNNLQMPRPSAVNVAETTFNSYSPYNDSLNNPLYLNTFFSNNPTTPRILGLLFEPSGISGLNTTATFGIISEDKKINELMSGPGANKREYIDVPICEESGTLLATFYDSNKTSGLIDFKMPGHAYDGDVDEIQIQLTDLVLKLLGPKAVGAASMRGCNHELYVMQNY
ncbi:MAG: hypothetical protein WC758_00390 [Candidatus Woesearchaeota archaeon]|jgi:hypothetical protein